MIDHLRIRGFKSWKAVTTNLGQLTGLFGTNSSGKTSLIQSLLLLKQTVESTDRAQVLNLGDSSSFVDLGTFSDVIYNHEASLPLEFEIGWKLSSTLVIDDPANKNKPLLKGDSIRFMVKIVEGKKNRLFVEKMHYDFGGYRFLMSRTAKEDRYEYRLTTKNLNTNPDAPIDFKLIRAVGRKWNLPQPVKFYGFPDQVNAYYQNASFLSLLQLKLEELFEDVYYMGPLRDYPRRQYSWGGANPSDMGRRGEQVVDAMLASKVRDKKISRGIGKKRFTVEEYVAYWLEKLGLIDSFHVKEIVEGLYRVYVKKTATSPEVLISDVGFGVSQILPVITLCYYAPKGSTLIVEQPEIHLHPSVQAGLADIFIDAIKIRGLQVIVESHSEYFIKRLQRRIAEGSFENTDASLFFCNNSNNKSNIENLKINIFGAIENWPQNFFGDEFDEVAMTAKAAIQKKRAIANGIHN